MGENGKQHLDLFKRECAASMCRMIVHLEHRNVADRALPPGALPPTADEAASQDLIGEAYDPIQLILVAVVRGSQMAPVDHSPPIV